jgi:hypothetical protein
VGEGGRDCCVEEEDGEGEAGGVTDAERWVDCERSFIINCLLEGEAIGAMGVGVIHVTNKGSLNGAPLHLRRHWSNGSMAAAIPVAGKETYHFSATIILICAVAFVPHANCSRVPSDSHPSRQE